MSVLLFFIVLFVLVLVHEWGHFIVAKKTGMRVDEFGIGFPPRLFGKKVGETEYTFNALPIGGFVRIYGENAEDAAEDAAAGKDVTRSFTAQPRWAQALVLIAGVTMNVVFAWFLFVIALMSGVPTAVDSATAGPGAQLVIQDVLPETPAAAAGLTAGTYIDAVAVDGQTYTQVTTEEFQSLTQSHANDALTLTVTDPGGSTEEVLVTPVVGASELAPDTAVIGVSLALVENVKAPLLTALKDATIQTGYLLKAITVGLGTLLVDSVRGHADLSSVTGPVGIVGMVGDAAHFGFTSLLMFTAMISLNLAVINLLPIPALDGGRLVFVAIEAVRRKNINPVWMARVNTVGFLALMLLMVAVTYRDIAKLW